MHLLFIRDKILVTMAWDWREIFFLITCISITDISVEVLINIGVKFELFVCPTRPINCYKYFSYCPISIKIWFNFQWCIVSFQASLHWILKAGWPWLVNSACILTTNIYSKMCCKKRLYYWFERSGQTTGNCIYTRQSYIFFKNNISCLTIQTNLQWYITQMTRWNIISFKRRWGIKPCQWTKEK